MSTYLRKIVNISDEQEEAIRLAIKRRYESAMIDPYNKRRGRPPSQKNNKAIKQGGRRRKRSRRKSHGQSTEALDGSIDLSRPSSSSFRCPRKPRPCFTAREILIWINFRSPKGAGNRSRWFQTFHPSREENSSWRLQTS